MRGLLIVLLALGLAVGAWFVLDPSTDDGYEPTGDGDPLEEEVAEDPQAGLVGRALDEPVQMAVTERPKGLFVIRGAVLDADGKPAAGIKIEALFNQPGWRDHSPEAVAWRSHDRVVARAARELREGPGAAQNVLAEAVSDAKGEFELDVGRTGRYHVHARPDAPRVGSWSWATVSRDQPTPSVTVRLAAGHALKGRVETNDGRPVVAVLTARLAPATPGVKRALDNWTSEPTRSAEDGTFELPAAPLGKLRFDVVVPGRMAAKGLKGEHVEGQLVTLVLPAGSATIGGGVVDADGAAIAGADVIVDLAPSGRGTPTQIEVATRSASDGSWQLDGLPVGEVRKIRAVAPGFVALMQTAPQAPWSPLQLEVGSKHTLTLRLLRGGTVSGRVTIADGGAPIEGTKVRLAMVTSPPGNDHQPLREAITDADGRYAIPGVPAGRYVLFATHETHYMPELVRPATPPDGAGPVPRMTSISDTPELTVVMPREGGDQQRDFTMLPGNRIAGVVVDPEGATVEGANVVVLQGLRRMRVPGVNIRGAEPTTSDADGRFEFANLPAGKGFVLIAKKTGYAAEKTEALDLVAGTDAPEMTLELVTGAVLRGSVTDENDDPVAGAQVSVWGANSGLSGSTTARTDAEGNFEIRGLAPGDYQHWAWAQGGMHAQGQGPKGLGAGEVREGLQIKMQGAVNTVADAARGRVVDDKGKAVAHRMVQIRGSSLHTMMQTNNEGMFTLPKQAHEQAVTITLYDATGMKELAKDVSFREGEVREFVFTPPKRQRIVGTVLDPQGVRVPLFRYGLKGKGRGSNISYEVPMVADGMVSAPAMGPGTTRGGEAVNGEFILDVFGEGPWTIVISNARDRQGRSVGLAKLEHVVTTLPTGPIQISLAPGETIQGRVVDTRGKPIEGVLVTCTETKDTSDAQGRFALAGMSGETTVYITPPAGQGWVRPQPAKARPGESLDIEIEEGLSISGSVTNEAGDPLAQLQVNANWQKGEGFSNGQSTVRPDSKGNFEIKGIPSRAKVHINVWAWGSAEGYAPFQKQDVAPGTRDLRIVMVKGTPISGRVLDAEGNPLKGGYVQAQPIDKKLSWGWGQIGSDGKFEINNTKPGKYKLMVQGHGTPSSLPVGEVTAPASGLELKLPAQVKVTGRIDGPGKGYRLVAYRKKGNSTERHNGSVKANGDFTVTLPEGGDAWTLVVHSESAGQYGYARDVAGGSTGVSVRTESGRSIKGQVVGGDGKGIGNVRVRAYAPGGGFINASVQADENGNFEIKGLPDGKYNLTGWGAGGTKNKQNVEAGTADVLLK